MHRDECVAVTTLYLLKCFLFFIHPSEIHAVLIPLCAIHLTLLCVFASLGVETLAKCRFCTTAAEVCKPAGVCALSVYSLRKLLTSNPTPPTQPPCVFVEDP